MDRHWRGEPRVRVLDELVRQVLEHLGVDDVVVIKKEQKFAAGFDRTACARPAELKVLLVAQAAQAGIVADCAF